MIGCDSRRCLNLRDDIQRMVDDLAAESRLSTRPNIELVDTELAVVFAQSMAATSGLPSTYSPLLKQAISLGRRLQVNALICVYFIGQTGWIYREMSKHPISMLQCSPGGQTNLVIAVLPSLH